MTSKSKTNKFVAVALSGLVAITMLAVGVSPAQAATNEELTAQINGLLAMIASLQAQLNSAPATGGSAGASAGYNFTRSLKQGDRGDDVKALQKALNSDSATQVSVSGAGSPGNETTSFGPATKAAVIKFQNKYASEILTPVGLSAGTGFVGASTRAKLNSLGGVAVVPPPVVPPPSGGGTPVPPVVVPTGSGLTVTASAVQPSAQLAPKNSARVPFTKVTFTASADGDVTVNGLVVERGGPSVDAVFSGVVLLDEDGTQLGLAKTLNSSHQTTLTQSFVVKAGQSRTLTLAGNRDAGADAHAGMVATLALKQVNTSATVNGSFPITGTAQTINQGLTIGEVTMARGALEPGVTVTKEVGINGYTFSSIRVTAGSQEDVRLRSVRWNETGSVSASDLANVKVVVDNTPYDVVVAGDYYTATFGSGIIIPKGGSKEISIKGDVVGGSGRNVAFDIAKRTDVNLVGEFFGYGITPPQTGSASTATGNFTSTEDPWFDGAVVTVSNGTINITSSTAAAPAQNIAVNTPGQLLGAFTADVKGEAISVGKIGFNVSLGENTDDDIDDILNVTLVDENGSVVAGPVDGSASDSSDTSGSGEGSISFTDTVTFPIGLHTYKIFGKIHTEVNNNTTVTASTTPDNDFKTVKGTVTGNTITPSPGSAITMSVMTVKSGALAISVSSVPIAQTVVAGAKGFEFARYVFDAGQSGEDIRVSSIPLAFGSTASSDRTELTNCQLFDGATSLTTGGNIKNPSTSDTASSTSMIFDGGGLVVPKGKAKTLSLKCDVSAAADAAYYWGIDAALDDSASTYTGAVGLTSAQTITETVTGSNGQRMTASGTGTLTVSLDDDSPSSRIVAAGTTGVELARIKFQAANEDVDLRVIGLQLSSVASNSPEDLIGKTVTLYDVVNPTVPIATATFGTGDTATSTQISGIRVTKDNTRVIIVKGDISPITASGPEITSSGELLVVDYDGNSTGLANGTYGVGVASGSNVTPSGSDTASAGVRIMKAYPVFTNIPLLTTEKVLSSGSSRTLYKFKVTAVGGPSGGSVGFYKWTFDIGSSTLAATTSLYSLYAYEDADFSQTDSFSNTGLINAGNCFSGRQSTAAGPRLVEIYPDKTGCNQSTTTFRISAGATRYFKLTATVADVETGSTNTDSITVQLAGDAAYSTSTLMMKASGIDGDANNDLIWTPNSTTTVNINGFDFTNGFNVRGLPANGATEEYLQSQGS